MAQSNCGARSPFIKTTSPTLTGTEVADEPRIGQQSQPELVRYFLSVLCALPQAVATNRFRIQIGGKQLGVQHDLDAG